MKSKLTKRDAAWYIAAMIDGEGCVFYKPETSGALKYVSISNTDSDIISFSERCLRLLGISYWIGTQKKSEKYKKRGWKQCYVINICKKNDFIKLEKLVPLACSRKLKKLRLIIKSYPKRTVLKKEKLAELYHGKLFSMERIGKVFRVDPATVQKAMQKHGISSRSHIEAQRNRRAIEGYQ